MKILNQYIVVIKGNYQVLYECVGEKYFATSTGAFNQRDMYIERLHASEAKKLLEQE